MPPSEEFDGTISPSGRVQMMTVLVDPALSAWIDDLRGRVPVENDFRFWASVVRRGLADLVREARLSSLADVTERGAPTFAVVTLPPGVSSSTEAVLIPFPAEDLEGARGVAALSAGLERGGILAACAGAGTSWTSPGT